LGDTAPECTPWPLAWHQAARNCHVGRLRVCS